MQNKQFKTEQLSTQNLSPGEIRSKSHQNVSTILFVRNLMCYLNICSLMHILLHTQKSMDSGIQDTAQANELSSVMTVYVNGFYKDVTTCMLQID